MKVRSENIDPREGEVAMGTIAMGFGERPPVETREWKPRSLARRRQFDLKRYSAVARRLVATPPQMQTPDCDLPKRQGCHELHHSIAVRLRPADSRAKLLFDLSQDRKCGDHRATVAGSHFITIPSESASVFVASKP